VQVSKGVGRDTPPPDSCARSGRIVSEYSGSAVTANHNSREANREPAGGAGRGTGHTNPVTCS
jgi:hypothetical protein